jgi:hypothetical protein
VFRPPRRRISIQIGLLRAPQDSVCNRDIAPLVLLSAPFKVGLPLVSRRHAHLELAEHHFVPSLIHQAELWVRSRSGKSILRLWVPRLPLCL